MSRSICRLLSRWVACVAVFVVSMAAQERAPIAFTNVNVVPMSRDTVLMDRTVVVQDGKLRSIGPSSMSLPQGATVIDGRGKYLIPALSDMHVHLEGDPWNIMFADEGKYTKDEVDFDDILFVYAAHGVAMVDVMFAFPEHLGLRERVRRGELLGPRLILSRMIDGAGKAWPPPLDVWINSPAEAARAVEQMHAEGYDRVKVYSFLDRASYDTIVATGKRLSMPVDGHIPFATSVEHVVASGQKMIAHAEEVMKFAKTYDAGEAERLASFLASSQTWLTSALVLNLNLNALLEDSSAEFSKAGTDLLHPMAKGIWAYVYGNLYKPIPEKGRRSMVDGYDGFLRPFVKALHTRGGRLMAGTDAPVPSTLPGSALHQELEELVRAGLTPYEALKTSTTNPYEFLGELDRSGTVEAGKQADLVLLDGDPRADISNVRRIAGVMRQGQWIPRNEIDRRVAQIRASYRALGERKRVW